MILDSFRQQYKINQLLFDLMWVIFLGYSLFIYSAWYALDYRAIYGTILAGIHYASAAVCLFLVIYNFIHKVYEIPDIIFYVVMGIIIFLSAHYSTNETYLWYFVFFAAAYRQDAGRVVFLTLCVTGTVLAVIVLCSQTGLAVDYIFDSATRARHGLGFSWTTTPPIIYLFFIMGYLYLRREKMKIWEYVILEAAAVYFYVMTDTNLTFCFSTGILVLMFVEGLLKNRWRFWSRLKWLWVCLPVLIFAASLVMVLAYHRDGAVWSRVNSLMHNRLTLGQNGINNYGLTLFGQPIWRRGFYITVSEVADYNYIDNSYLQMMLEFGVLFLAVVLALYTRSIYRAVQKKDYYLVWILAAILLFSVMEPWLMSLPRNVFTMTAFLGLDSAAPKEEPQQNGT